MSGNRQLSITVSREAGRVEWEEVCRSCSHATFFHTPLWADIFSRAGVRMVPAAEKVEFSDGASAVLPLIYKWYLTGRVRLYFSMPAGTYGGWVSADELTEAHARLLADRLFRIRNLVWRENPYDPLMSNIDLPGAEEDFTQVIDLRNGYEEAKKRSDYAHRRAVRRAIEKGVSVTEASSFEEWRNYFLIYRASLERWKAEGLLRGRGYTLAFFKEIFESPVAHRKLWLALVQGRPVYGTLCFYWNRHAVSWTSAGDADFFKEYRPNDFLQDHILREAAGAGYDWYDCNPSAGLKGVVEFKEHIGAKKLRSRIVNRRSFLREAAELFRGVIR